MMTRRSQTEITTVTTELFGLRKIICLLFYFIRPTLHCKRMTTCTSTIVGTSLSDYVMPVIVKMLTQFMQLAFGSIGWLSLR